MDAKTYKNTMLEGGEGFNAIEIEEERTASARFEASLVADGWTLDETKTKREAWNAECLRAKKQGRKINLMTLETKMGFKHNTLKAAISHYGL